jgi:hypothetical protein
MDLMNKIYQVPGTIHIPLYWWVNGDQENNARYQNLCLGLALSPRGGAWAHKIDGEWPPLPDETAFGEAVDEYRDSRFVRIGLEPAWWNDLETQVEAYTLKSGDTYLVNVTSHHDEPRDLTVSVDVEPMGLSRDEPVFIWQHQARPVLIAGSQYPDDKRDRLHSKVTFEVVASPSGRLTLPLADMPVDRIRLVSLTQSPAFIYSVDGIRTQSFLSEALGCTIRGRLHPERKAVAIMTRADRPFELIAYWPEEWGKAQVYDVDRPYPSEILAIDGKPFLLIKGDTGLMDITIRALGL